LGTAVVASPPQVGAWEGARVSVVRTSRFSMASTSPRSAGSAEISSATAPATCGPAIEVPLQQDP